MVRAGATAPPARGVYDRPQGDSPLSRASEEGPPPNGRVGPDISQDATMDDFHYAHVISASSPAGTVAAGGVQVGDVSKLHLEACQIAMDECYDKAIHPEIEALEMMVFQGKSSCLHMTGLVARQARQPLCCAHRRARGWPTGVLISIG